MTRNEAIRGLVEYALEKELIRPEEQTWATNLLLDALKLDAFSPEEVQDKSQTDPVKQAEQAKPELTELLDTLLDDAYERGVLEENSVVYRDLFDTRLMGLLTPRPSWVREKFAKLRAESPEKATDWYYQFSQDTNYIRRDRIARDMRWKTDTEYGELDITINLSKPERIPKPLRQRETSRLPTIRAACFAWKTKGMQAG